MGYPINVDIDEMDIEKRAFLKTFDEIISRKRDGVLEKRLSYIDCKTLFKEFTI